MTGQRHAIAFRIKGGTQVEVAAILSSYGRPIAEIDDYTRLLATTVLIKDDVVVRIIEIEGSMPAVMQHLSRQPEIQAVERAIPFLVEDRDLSTPSGTRNFYMRAIMDPVTDPAPVVPPADRDPAAQPYAVLYRFQAGRGAEADACFTADGETSVFRNGDIGVRYYESTRGAQEAIEHMVRLGVAESSGLRLQDTLATPADLTSEEGWRRFVTDHLMLVATHRVAPPTTPTAARPSRAGATREPVRRSANRVIDFHTHLVPERWARIGNIPPQLIDVDAFFAGKEAAGIEMSVIINAMFHHPASREDVRGLPMQREFIDFAHNLMAAHPGAVTAFIGVNPFGGEAALRAMEEAVRGGDFPGVTVNSSVDGELLDSPRAADFWALAAELDVPVFIHPPLFVSPQQVDWDPRFLGFAVRPLDVTLCVAAIVTAGILEKYPRLRIVCASGGGMLAELAERLNLAYSPVDLGLLPDGALRAGASAPPAAELTARPSEYIRRLYIDTCMHGTHAFLANLDLFGPGHLVFGTDNPPVTVSMTGEIETIESLLTSDEDRELVLWRNGADLLRLPGQSSSQYPATRTATSKM